MNLRSSPQLVALMLLIAYCLTPGAYGQIIVDGEPNLDDDRLYAWYDGDEALGADGIPETPIWPNKQGDELRDIRSGYGVNVVLQPTPTENGHLALRYEDVVTWRDAGEWGILEDEMTIFVAATVRDVQFAYFFTGNQGGPKTEANAGYGGADFGFWSIRGPDDWVQTAEVVEDELQYHAFTFTEDGDGFHYINGELVGEGYVGVPSFQGFVLGGRQNGFERASVDFAEVLIYDVALTDEDRQAIEMYLDNKFFGSPTVRGDFNGNGMIDLDDIDILTAQSASGDNLPQYDLTGDGLVNVADVNEWAQAKDIGYTWIGDANYDGQFNTGDFVQVLGIGKYEQPGATAVWSEGDWNGDGVFGTGDLVAALSDGGYEIGPRTDVAAVPEPSAIVLSLLGLAGLVGLTRRRQS